MFPPLRESFHLEGHMNLDHGGNTDSSIMIVILNETFRDFSISAIDELGTSTMDHETSLCPSRFVLSV